MADTEPSDVADLLAGYQAAGVQLWVEDGKLRYRAPHGVMTADRLARLRACREEIVAALAAPGPGLVAPDPTSRYASFPLTDVQAAYLVGRGGGYPYGGVGCHGYGELVFDGVDPVRLDDAWAALVRRHDMLRAVISADGTQRVLAEAPDYHIGVDDLGAVGPERMSAAVEQTRTRMDHRLYRPDEWPLFDLRLTRAGGRAVLHFSIDFLIADFVSLQILLRELEEAYHDPAATPPDLELTFRDALLAGRAERTGPAAARDRDYWLARVDDLPEPPDLPVLPTGRSPARFQRHAGVLDPDTWAALRERAGRAGVTASTAVLAGYAEVLRRWSRQPAFTVSVTVLRRPPVHPRIGSVVGDFTSVELLAVPRPVAGESFWARAATLQGRLWEDLDHGRFSGVEVLRELRRQRGEALLYPIVFTSSIGVGAGPGPGRSGGGMSRLAYGISQTPQVWLDCQVMEVGGGLTVNWDVRTGVFPDGLVEEMFAAFVALLRRLAADDAAGASADPVPVPSTQLARRPVPDHSPPPDALLVDAFLARARLSPDAPAVLAGGRALGYGEVAELAEAVARVLDGWGCSPGSRIAVEMDKGWEQVPAVLGTLLAGCAYVPLDTSQPPARRERILADVGAQGILTQSWLADHAHRRGIRSTAVDALRPVGPVRCPDGRATDLAYVIYTSGSTGAPKGVMISHGAAWNTVDDINRRFGLGPDDRVLGLANLGFDLSVYDIFGTLAAGGTLVLPDADRRADPSHWAELIESRGVTVWNSVPAQLEMLLAALRADPDRPVGSLRLALLSGDWIPVALPGQIRRHLPDVRLIGLGGATEAAIWSIAHPIERVDEAAPSIPYGRPLTRQSVRVLGDDLRPVPDLVAGELYIGGAGLSGGYWNDPRTTAARYVSDPDTGERLYRTGDFGRYLPDGAIEFLGRADSQVKIRGHRVELAEVESALTAHPAVGAAAVITVGQRPAPIRLAAFVEPAARPADQPPPGVSGADLAAAATTAAADLRAGVDEGQMLAFARQLDRTGLNQMLAALREQGLFGSPEQEHGVAEVLERARVAPRHHRLVRRWLRALADNGLLCRDPATGGYRGAPPVTRDEVAHGWREVVRLLPEVERRTELITYFRTAADHLPALLRGDVDPLTLLFPEGRTEIHEVAYTAMFLSQYVNRLLTSAACHLAERRTQPSPMRVLEVGAGVGGTSVELIPALARYDVEYTFTDVSEFFLNNARRRFAAYPWMRYQLYDMNADFRRQGLLPHQYDLVVCANVLHYARDVGAVLGRLRQLLTPGGWILFIEATRDSYQIMTSMEFLFDEGIGEFADVRREREQTFVTREQWLSVLADAAADTVVSLPDRDPITDQMGMHVFAARFKSDRAWVDRKDLDHHLSGQLPDHMIPSVLQVVDQLPLTGNGKVDRRTLAGWLPDDDRAPAAAADDEPPRPGPEQHIARVWGELLRREGIGRSQNFFELGGDSLLAAQVATEVRQAVPGAADVFYDDLLRMLLENPTVAGLAARLAPGRNGVPGAPGRDRSGEPSPAAAGQAAGPPGSTLPPSVGAARGPLVWLSKPAGGTPVPTVLVHGASGTLAGYQPLVELLPAGAASAGLVVGPGDGYLDVPAGALLDEVAARYTRAVRSAGCPRVRLVGRHFGAVLAAEVARQLVEVGVGVDRLVVVAGGPMPWRDAGEAGAAYLFSQELGVAPALLGLTGGPGDPVTGDGPRWDRLTGPVGGLPPGPVPGLPAEQAFSIFKHSLAGAAASSPLPYAGDITLVRPVTDAHWPTIATDLAGYWQEICLGDLEVVDVSAGYGDCLTVAAGDVARLLTGDGRG